MTARNDGGPAFPVDCNWQDGVPTSGVQTSNRTGMATGVTVRDYFAAKAPMPTNEWWTESYSQPGDVPSQADVMARWAFAYADAMLAARGQP